MVVLRYLKVKEFLFFFLPLCFISAINLPVFGDAPPQLRTYRTILIMSDTQGMGENETLDDIMLSGFGLEFERLGLAVTRYSKTPGMDFSQTLRDFLEAAARLNTDLAAYCIHEGAQSEIDFELTCLDAKNPELSVSVSKSGSLDLSLDTLIADTVNEFLIKFKEKVGDFTFMKPGPIQEKPAAQEPGSQELVSEEQPRPETAETIPPPKEPAETPIPERFYLSIGAAPFIAIGKINYYFSIGLLASLHANYIVRTTSVDFGLGLFTGFQFFQAQGLIVDSNNFLVPLGADVYISSPMERNLSFFLHFSGGVALFFFKPMGSPQLSKLIGYVSGGAGGAIRFKRFFSISLDVSYFTYFEELYPIMGIAPSVYGTVRF